MSADFYYFYDPDGNLLEFSSPEVEAGRRCQRRIHEEVFSILKVTRPGSKHHVDPSLPQPLPAQSSRYPVRRGQPIRSSHPRDPRRTPRGGREGLPRNDEDGEVIV